MGLSQSGVLAQNICKCVEGKEWGKILHFLDSEEMSTRQKRIALMNIRKGILKSPFLCLASSYGIDVKVFRKALDICGNDLLFQTNNKGATCIHTMLDIPSDRLKVALEVGGIDLLMMNAGLSGRNPLQYALLRRASIEQIKMLIKYGGVELVSKVDDSEQKFTSLHLALTCGSSAETLYALMEAGGRQLVMIECYRRGTAFDYFIGGLSQRRHFTLNDKCKVFRLFMEIIGFEDLAFHLFKKSYSNLYGFLIRGNPSFTTSNWSAFYKSDDFPYLFPVIVEMFKGRPFLQKAIGFATKDALIDIIDHFDGCIWIKDGNGQLPIEVANQKNLGWNEGIKILLDATVASDKYKRSSLVIACTYGLKWRNGLSVVFEEEKSDAKRELQMTDTTSGLFPALLLASHVDSDLQGIYELVKSEPSICLNHSFLKK